MNGHIRQPATDKTVTKPKTMKQHFLLPHRFKTIGWVILIPTLLLCIGVLLNNYGFGNDFDDSAKSLFRWLGFNVRTTDWISSAGHWINNLCIFGLVIGGLFVGCSRERTEDEMIARLRLDALLVALWINYAILLVAALLVYDLQFIDVMIYNLFTMLGIFVIVFQWKLWRLKHTAQDEE